MGFHRPHLPDLLESVWYGAGARVPCLGSPASLTWLARASPQAWSWSGGGMVNSVRLYVYTQGIPALPSRNCQPFGW